MVNNTLVHIGNADISVKEYKGQRVVILFIVDQMERQEEILIQTRKGLLREKIFIL